MSIPCWFQGVDEESLNRWRGWGFRLIGYQNHTMERQINGGYRTPNSTRMTGAAKRTARPQAIASTPNPAQTFKNRFVGILTTNG